jgi:hypothetical protein
VKLAEGLRPNTTQVRPTCTYSLGLLVKLEDLGEGQYIPRVHWPPKKLQVRLNATIFTDSGWTYNWDARLRGHPLEVSLRI